MPDREKLIRALMFCCYDIHDGDCYPDCPYYDACSAGSPVPAVMYDALALLKEQEPRVMTWDELMRLANGDPAFMEASDRSCCWVLVYPTYMGLHDKNGYGVRWRYWTSRPTDEQRKNTPWEAADNGNI